MTPFPWHDRAACRTADPALFFPPDGERYDQPSKRRREERAKAVCASCPVNAECLAHAVSRPEKYGTWGATTEEERAAERKREQRRDLARRKREEAREEAVA